jgi:hypothetical protein
MPVDNTPENMVITRVTRHEVLRRRERILIDLHEVMEGRTERPFAAIPVSASGAWCNKRFWGTGYSNREALSACLEKIRDVDSEVLFAP